MKVGLAVERHGVPVGVLTDAANVGEPDLGSLRDDRTSGSLHV